mmetsp:Transcript_89321/g.253107  ORF Transcript_89321/g.253107 Transcript_89321/m.253107 type:complete len:98 (+) Transcript_89321:386-679(+)
MLGTGLATGPLQAGKSMGLCCTPSRHWASALLVRAAQPPCVYGYHCDDAGAALAQPAMLRLPRGWGGRKFPPPAAQPMATLNLLSCAWVMTPGRCRM